MAKILSYSNAPLFEFSGTIGSISRCDENGNCYIATYDVASYIFTLYIYKFNIFTKNTELIASKSNIGSRSSPVYNTVNIQVLNNLLYIIIKHHNVTASGYYDYTLYYLNYDLNTNNFGDLVTVREETSITSRVYYGNMAINADGTELTIVQPYDYTSGITKHRQPRLMVYNIETNTYSTYQPSGITSVASTSPSDNYLIYANEGGSGFTTSNTTYIFSNPHTILYNKTSYSPEYYIQIPNTYYYIGNTSYGILDGSYNSILIGNENTNFFPCVLDDDYIVTIDNTNKKYNIFILEEYDLTFTFKTDSEDVVLTNKAPITSIDISYRNNIVGIKLTFLNGAVEGISYPIYTPNDKTFSGLSLNPNALTPYLPIGTTNIELNKSLTFYPVFTQYRPLTKNFNIIFYNNSSEPNRVDKTDYLTKNTEVVGVFRTETSITNITLTIEQDNFPLFNYAYIPIFNRYYFITDITSLRYGLWEISLQIDVLMTYKNAIKSCNCFCDRNEFLYNDNIIDKKRIIEQGYDVESIAIQNDLFVDGNGSLVIQGFNLGTWND